MKFLILLFLAMPTTAWADEDNKTIYCVPHCTDRSITGMCLRYGSDFCTPFEGTACIPHCRERMISGRCLGYRADFCGVYPECAPYCEESSISGRCLRWGTDYCVG